MNALVAGLALLGALLLSVVLGLVRARLAARYVVRVYMPDGQLWTMSAPHRWKRDAERDAWDRAHGLGRMCQPRESCEGFTSETVKL